MKKFVFTLAFVFAVVLGYSQITANFTWSDPQCAGGTIVFNDASIITPGDPATWWEWYINGSPITAGSFTFSHTFPLVTVPTNFDVSLYVTTGMGFSDNITYTVTIYPLPDIAIVPLDPTICEGSSLLLTASGGNTYSWNTIEVGATITPTVFVPTTFTVTGTDLHGCINTASTDVSVYLIDTTVVNDGFCQGDSYDFYGTPLTSAGTYYHTLTSVLTSCDSVIQLELIANPIYFFPETHEICDGDVYLWHGVGYTTAGTYTASYVTVHGCDSIYELELTVRPTYFFTETHEICDGDVYSWHGVGHTTAGTYTASYVTVHGCDSIYELELTVHPVYEFVTDESVCAGNSVQWRGQWYSVEDTYTESFTTIYGCDSTYVLNLTVNELPVNYLVQSIPSNGILPLSTTGTITISWSDLGVNYWVETGSIHVTGNIPGTGALLNLGTNYTAGTYDIWSKNAAGCELKQGSITFVENNGTTKIVGTPTYGDAFNSFVDGAVEMTLYLSTVDIYGNPVIIVEDGPTATGSGDVEFDNLDAGDYYLRSQVIDTATYNTVFPIFFFDGPTVDFADIITIIDHQILSVNINHPEYPDTTGSNTAGGIIDTLGGGNKSGGIPNQIVILRNEITGEILSAVISDNMGQYFIEHLPDNSDLELYVTSFEYQNWVPAGISSATNTHYTINFVVDGDMVYPEGWVGVSALKSFKFNIYPNPTTDFIQLENVPDGSLLQVFDLQGKLVVFDSRSHKSVLDVSSLPVGTYVLVITNNGAVGTHKLIKN